MIRIFNAEFRTGDLRLIGGDGTAILPDGGNLAVQILTRQCILRRQFAVARQRQLRTFQQRLVFAEFALILVKRGLKAARIDLRQQLPGADFLPSVKKTCSSWPSTRLVTVTLALGMTVPSAFSHTGTSAVLATPL